MKTLLKLVMVYIVVNLIVAAVVVMLPFLIRVSIFMGVVLFVLIAFQVFFGMDEKKDKKTTIPVQEGELKTS